MKRKCLDVSAFKLKLAFSLKGTLKSFVRYRKTTIRRVLLVLIND